MPASPPERATPDTRPPGDEPWAWLLRDVLERRDASEPLPPPLQPDQPDPAGELESGLPLSRFFQPFLQTGAARLRAGLAELRACHQLSSPWLTTGAEASLLISLAHRLQALATRTLISTSWFERPGALGELLDEYPVLARRMSTTVERWLVAALELFERLAADRALLGETFLAGRALGAVTEVEAGLSDPHREGRSVVVLTFGSGLRLVYKPKSLAVDERFQGLHRVLTVLDRGTYGWVEFV